MKTTEEFKTSLEKRQSELNSYFTEEENKRLSDCQSKLSALQTVSKLAEFADSLNKTSTNDNILTHLCDGLEKFLGFNSTSKGYDGQGIVYSDLDRLCDAVMGFLYQVLKDVSEKQPYKVGRDILIKLIDEQIKPNLSTGREGFSVIEQVADRVREYNESVKESNEKVKKPINNLLTYCRDQLPVDVSKILPDENTIDPATVQRAVGQVDDKLEECKKYSQTFDRNMNAAIENISELHHETNVTVMNANNIFSNEYQRICKLSAKEWNDRVTLENEISKTLTGLMKSTKEEIFGQINNFVNSLKEKVAGIVVRLMEINSKLEGHVKNLKDWIRQATETMTGALSKVDSIVDTVSDDPVKGKKEPVRRAAQELQGKADDLRRKAYAATQQVKKLVEEALKGVKNMDEELRKNLKTVRDGIKKGIMQYIKGSLASKIKSELDKLVETIYKEHEGTKSGLLGDVIRSIGSHVMSFQSGFTQSITEMVEKIVQSEGVKEYLENYVRENKSKGRLNINSGADGVQSFVKSTLNGIVTRHINSALVDAINRAKEKITYSSGDVAVMLTSISTCLSQFSSAIDGANKLTPETIAGEIESSLKDTQLQSSGFWYKSYLTNAVKTALSALKLSTEKASEKILALVVDSRISQLNDAASKVPDLGKGLEDVIKGAGSSVAVSGRPFGDDVNEEIAKIVNGKIGEDDKINKPDGVLNPDKVTLTDQFKTYKKHIDTSKVGKGANLTGDEGSVPSMIKVIETTVNANDSFLGKLTDARDDSPDPGAKDDKFYENTFDKCCKKITKALDGLCAAVEGITGKGDEPGDGTLKSILKTFQKQTLKGTTDAKHLQKIHDDLYMLRSEKLTNAISSVTQFLTFIDESSNETIAQLHKYITEHFNYTTLHLTTHARRNYVSSVKQLLAAFAEKVSEELKGLPEEIERDLRIGFKGLMGKMETHFIKKVKEIKSIKNSSTSQQGRSHNPGDVSQSEVGQAAENVRDGFESLFEELMKQTDMFGDVLSKLNTDNKHNETIQKQFPPLLQTVISVSRALENTFSYLTGSHHYDHIFSEHLHALSKNLSDLTPTEFGDTSSPILKALKEGFLGIIRELQKVYINTYSGQTIKWDEENNADKTYCAKVCLTILGTIFEDLQTLNRFTVKQLATDHIYMYKVAGDGRNKSLNPLGDYFQQRGYKVPSDQHSQDGELRQCEHWNGKYINVKLLNQKLKNVTNIEEHLKACDSNKDESTQAPKKADKFNIFDLLKCIYHHVDTYNEVCHLATFTATRSPCSVYEMLIWLSGLTHSGVHPAMVGKTFLDLLRDPAKEAKLAAQDNDDGELQISFGASDPIALDAYPKSIEFVKLGTTLNHICSKAYDLICKIVGTGDEFTTYGCDYSNNSFKLKYPSDPAACFDMLLDILRRLLPALRYLFQRCNVTAEHHGWRNCEYGKDVPTSKSHCSRQATDKATTQPTCQPTCEAKCQPTSPLMSYLNDCLPGHLPHSLTDIGCKSVCSNCPSAAKLGMPCLTPMGFRGFSGSTKTGADLCEIIREFFGSGLVSSLFSLSPTPPKTLPEHFGFGLSLVNRWVNVATYVSDYSSKPVSQSKIEASIEKLSIKLYTDTGKLTNVLRDAYGNSQHEHRHLNHLEGHADVSSLCMNSSCEDRVMRCAPYLSTLCSDTYQYLAHKNFATYLTWAVYLPWDFWHQLNNLCNAFKNLFCQDWGCHTCLRADKCKRGQHGLVEKVDKTTEIPHCKCPSMVQCKGVSATLYQFGFSFGNAATLNTETSPKSCSDFCTQLDKVLKSDYFVKLFTECDNFIWTIREPFTYLVLALWSLSLFYLICVMVGRLDVLHIRSHLRIPSSHRITAQSLLAAAQVGRLAKISYLQP